MLKMKKLLLILLFLPIIQLTSCSERNSSKEDDTIISFNITSKNTKLTLEKGTNVGFNEMITKTILSGDSLVFKNFEFTLNNNIEGAFNFYSNKSKLMSIAPTELSIMNMPPDGSSGINYIQGQKIEFSGISLIKINGVNFVISDIKTKNK